MISGMSCSTGEVYPLPDLAALPTSSAPMPALAVDSRCAFGGLLLSRLQSFCVPKADIVANGYDLSFNRYKGVVYEEAQYVRTLQYGTRSLLGR